MGNVTHSVRALAKIEGQKVTVVSKRFENDIDSVTPWCTITGTLSYSEKTSEWQVSTNDATLNFTSDEVLSVDDNRPKLGLPLIRIFWDKG